MERPLRNPWLVAVWPGMGGVAQIAGTYLVRQLEMQPLVELDTQGFFDQVSISVQNGLVQPPERPRSVFYVWRNPGEGRDLVVLLGDRQPNVDGARYCQALLELAEKHGIERVYTFAAMATPIHPAAEPRVFAAATSPECASELEGAGATRMRDGEVTGLNGVFVSVAAERGLSGACLLGEFPFFAATVPNPKASVAVLRVFAQLAGIAVPLAELVADARKFERGLIEHLESLQKAARLAASREEREEADEEGDADESPAEEFGAPQAGPSKGVLRRIEALFKLAKGDRSRALELKTELDRHGLFRDYEDRFLDLFKQAN
ncbi:MAG: PAC2 family protein [Planctomycetaceae bacterium]|nr:PAC2 family protein [Planctomycetaceae bacterium]